MKCIYCQTDNLYRDRTTGQCKKCKRRFAFEPKTDFGLAFEQGNNREWKNSPLTDPAFQNSLNAVSENNTLYFTPRQLYYQVLRRKAKGTEYKTYDNNSTSQAGGCFLFFMLTVGTVIAGFALSLPVLITVLAAVAIFLTGVVLPYLLPQGYKGVGLASKALLSYSYFQNYLLSKWVLAHGAPPRMLPDGGRLRPALQSGQAANLESYSFDRLLVCDKAETADMLLANNFHFETNTPIVSIEGYPQDIFPGIMSMVKRNPNLKVFALHDATAEGCLLPLRLREDPNWFPDPQIKIFDIGLRPRQVASMPNLIVGNINIQINQPIDTAALAQNYRAARAGQGNWRRVELSTELRRYLAPGERKWLEAGYYAELAAFKPSRLLRAIYNNFNRAAEEEVGLQEQAANDPRNFFQTLQPGVRPAFDSQIGGTVPPIQIGQVPPTVAPDAPAPPRYQVVRPDSPPKTAPGHWPEPKNTQGDNHQ